MPASDMYHHGDLRNALVTAAAQLIEERGEDNFKMSDAARSAGVSAAAPYRHFEDKADLLMAVAQLGFYALTVEAASVVSRQEKGSAECIIAVCEHYLGFVTRHSAFFELMWGNPDSRALEEEYARLRTNGFWIFIDVVEAWCVAEQISDRTPLDLSLELWALCLGFSSLMINEYLELFAPEQDAYAMLAASVSSFLQGIKIGR